MNKNVCKQCYHVITNHRPHYCVLCRSCYRYCECRKRAGAGPVKNSRRAGIGSSSILIKSRRAIGIELELSDWGTWGTREGDRGALHYGNHRFNYKIDHDGSVRPGGREAVFEPLEGDQRVIMGLNAIADKVYTENCNVNVTCGYHVHVNAKDFNWYDIQRTILLWLKIENYPGIFKLCGRMPNNHCRMWSGWLTDRTVGPDNVIPKDINKFKKWFIESLYDINVGHFKDSIEDARQHNYTYKDQLQVWKDSKMPLKYRPKAVQFAEDVQIYKGYVNNRGWNRAVAARYLNLNLHSWKYRGTIEYRLGAGTVNVTDIRMWPLFCLWLTEAIACTTTNIIETEYLPLAEDPILTMCKHGGILINTFKGRSIYPMPDFLRDWIISKNYNK